MKIKLKKNGIKRGKEEKRDESNGMNGWYKREVE